MTKKLILAAFVAAMALTSCHKDPVPTPDPEPQTVTRLAREENTTTSGMITMNSSADYLWEKGKLMRVCDTISLTISNTIATEKMVYEDGNIVRIEEESGKWSDHFTYENGLIVSFLNIHQGDTAIWGTASYNADGLVEDILCHTRIKTTKWHLTWVDGDATEVVEEILEPEVMAGTHVYYYAYDDKPCVYDGFPMAYSILDGDGTRVAMRQSKHNRIREGYTYYYNTDNGLLISAAAENDSVYYHYIDMLVE
ncbi:MAG: hypothetical protein IK135_06860 [Bacteroidales bacterium]|nr:hypothetical protein [Bacteroidales bacterium]